MQENINIPDSEITTNLTFRQLVLMNMQQLTNFPYIEKDFDALTDYELLCLVVKFLNDVIANQNEQNASITRMYESFLALQDYVNNTKDELETAFNNLDNYVRYYFDNLDVQEEINNKLDQMLEDGVLEQIIEQFIQSTALWCFDTVADMKLATNFTNGSYAKTLGYRTKNDGGTSIYKIRTKTNEDIIDEMFLIAVYDNTLVAELISNKKININQLGAYNDGENDDSSYLQAAIDNFNEVELLNGTYLINTSVNVNKTNLKIYGNKNTNILVDKNIYVFTIDELNNVSFEDFNVTCSKGGFITCINDTTNFGLKLNNIRGSIESSYEMINLTDIHDVIIKDCYFRNNDTNNPTCLVLDGVINASITLNKILYFNNGIIFKNESTKTNEGVIINKNLLYQNNNQITSSNTNSLLFIDINNNIIDFCETKGIYLQNIESSIISDNYFGINNEDCYSLYIRQLNGSHTDLSINDNKFINYLQTMVSPTIKINNDGDERQVGLKIKGNHATIYKTFIELYNCSYTPITDNSCASGVIGNRFILGDSNAYCNFNGNYNGGNPLYTSCRLGNLNVSPDNLDVKSSIAHDTYYKPTNSSGFYLNITFANATTSDVSVNLIMSKDGTNSILAGNTTVRASGLAFVNIYVPDGYYIKYNTTTASNIVVQNAHAIY